MSYTLILGDPAYSSWSLRGWLLFRRFGIDVSVKWVDFTDASGVSGQMEHARPARTVPTLVDDKGAVIWDSLALAEEIAQRFPEAGLWPNDPSARATARSLAAEMHSGFSALRGDCPMNLRVAYSDFRPSEAVLADVARLEDIWSYAREIHAADGPWLCGAYSIADVFYAPVAARIATYGLPVSAASQAYVMAHLNDPAFRRWRAIGDVMGETLPWYAKDNTQKDWPGPAPLHAEPVEDGPAENDACPYSGDPVTHFLNIDGRVWGFCNAFCRDKTVADPAAWPEFMNLFGRD